ncbi:Secondary metabolism regulator LAE1 [Colletotrichum sp. SAR11_239]|nr:Secondary metabolism regulator LAE1 [Colletotrichum sp. SAR11_239]
MAQLSANIPNNNGEIVLAADEPTDDSASELGHNLFLVTYDNKLGTAPPNDKSLGVEVKRVLDVGTGTGVWAIEFGDEHPEAEVLGIDLSAIQPDFGLAPGGYFEMNEMDYPTSDDGTLQKEHALHRYLDLVFGALEKSGRAFQSIPALRDMMVDIGFRDVTMKKYKWPTNPWAKDVKHKKIGAWNNENLNAGVEAWAMAPFTRIHGWTQEEVQVFLVDTIDDGASSIGSLASSTTSVSGSILDYRLENGRTYHRYKDGTPPNEKGAQVKRALDVGTGTGLWAIEFGDEHPEAEVIGVDLSAVQIDFVPPNVKFEIDDIKEPWTFSKPFDYIHSRMMTSSIANWQSYLQKCYDGLEPGGYLELDEFDIFPDCDDDTFPGDLAISKALGLLAEAMAKIGRAFQSVPELRQMMVDIGFEDVHFKQYKWPINIWPKDPKYKELGMWENENLNMGFEGFLMGPLTRILDWSPAEVQVLLIDVRRDLNNRHVHAYWPVYSLWGQKPTEDEVTN